MKKYLTFILSMMMLIIATAGCGTVKDSKQSSGAAPGKGPLDKSYEKYVSAEKTGYFVISNNDEHTYLKKEHPMVQEIRTVVQGFSHDLIERDYRNDTGDKEYKWYAKSVVQQLTEKKDAEKTAADLKKYEVIQKENGTTVAGIIFTDSGKTAKVAFEAKTSWEKASPEFLSKNKVRLNIGYTMQGIVILTREDGQWRVMGSTLNAPKMGS